MQLNGERGLGTRQLTWTGHGLESIGKEYCVSLKSEEEGDYAYFGISMRLDAEGK